MQIETKDLPELSGVQQARQQRIFQQGAQVVRSARATDRLEARETGQLTFLQSIELRTVEEKREGERLKAIVRNFEKRQAAMLAEQSQ